MSSDPFGRGGGIGRSAAGRLRPVPDLRSSAEAADTLSASLHLSGPFASLGRVVQSSLMRSDADEGLEALYRDLAPRIWRALVAYTGAPEVASDALNEAFAQALARGSEIAAPERWLWTTTFRIAAGDLKERRRFSPPQDAPAPHAPEDTTELLDALRHLPPKQRAALVLHYYGGYKTREIAGILGSSAATVRVHLSAGRKRLRELLEAEDD